ncbi:hypothetical protein [Dysgonomonas sp. 520]|uniref:hypothetical protein n=1 Tax=Dysgonomonas sp. 520 TaxID=2302931 RepID=UPI0013D0EDFB|nr:hypothetical protein [Dysgonomonas sp. 520]
MKLKYTLLLLFTLISINLSAQQTDEEKRFINELLVDEDTGEYEDVELNMLDIPYCINIGEDVERFSVCMHMLAHEDLNGDGIEDYVIWRVSEGMLGGNANTNNEYIYYIMKDDRTIDKKYSVLGYAPFSYNILDEMEYKDGKLKGVATQNFRTYYNEDGELKSTPVSFLYKDGNLYEESYLNKCEMGKMKDKTIFKSDLPNVERDRNIDMHDYTEYSSEKCVKGDTLVTASLSGCDNLSLSFELTLYNFPHQAQTKEFYQQKILDLIGFLRNNTRYKSTLQKVADNYKKQTYKDNEEKTGTLDNKWTYTLSKFQYNSKRKAFQFRLSVGNMVNPNQTENWEITSRKK